MKISPTSLKTVHPSPETDTAEHWSKNDWFTFDAFYSYKDVHAGMLKRTAEAAMPVVLLETFYESERVTNSQTIRRNAYGALLAGAAGQFFGNNPMWHFSSSGLEAYHGTWRDALNSPGAQSMTALKTLFDKLPWSQLQPDRERRIAVNPQSYASFLSDGTMSVIYGDANGFAVQKDSVKNGQKAVWYDPFPARLPMQASRRLRVRLRPTCRSRQKYRWRNRLAFVDRQCRTPAGHPKEVGDTPFHAFHKRLS